MSEQNSSLIQNPDEPSFSEFADSKYLELRRLSKHDMAPDDKQHRIYFTVLFYGIAMLVPWNAVLSTMVFFKDELPGTNISFMISFAMNGIMVFIVIAIVFFSADKIAHRFLRVHLVFLCTAPVLMAIPVIVH